MFEFIDRRSDVPTPGLVKATVIIYAILTAGGMSGFARANALQLLILLISTILYILALIGFWNLRRWSVVALGLVNLISFLLVLQFPNVSVNPLIMGFIIRCVLLAPGLVYWQRMRW
jgi:hypothetical protein